MESFENNISKQSNDRYAFNAKIDIIGINPFVYVPEKILKRIFKQANQEKGPIPIQGQVNGKPYKQTLVKYTGAWRLYVNLEMLENSPKRIGEIIHLTTTYDTSNRTIPQHPKLNQALKQNQEAHHVFQQLSKSKQQEIIKYFSFLKTEEIVDKNILRVIDFLLGKGRFLGRDKP